MTDLILVLVIGSVTGWLVGKIKGLDHIMGMLLGAVGGFLGHFIFGFFKLSLGPGMIGTLLPAVIGGLVVVLFVGVLKKT